LLQGSASHTRHIGAKAVRIGIPTFLLREYSDGLFDGEAGGQPVAHLVSPMIEGGDEPVARGSYESYHGGKQPAFPPYTLKVKYTTR
jgi:hypothetical protein